MKTKSLVFLLLILFFQNCTKEDEWNSITNSSSEESLEAVNFRSNEDFEVFFAQTHVLRPTDLYFGLVSDKPALIKVHLTAEHEEPFPDVSLTLSLDGNQETISLQKPIQSNSTLDFSPGQDAHVFEDSYTTTIAKEWIQPGLSVRIVSDDKSVEFNDLKIGAPNRVVMNMFDVHCFGDIAGTPEGEEWKEELEAKWPTAGIDLRREKIVFPELTIPPRGGFKAIRLFELNDYWDSTGVKIDGEQLAAVQWKDALRDAAGIQKRREMFFVNYYGIPRARGGQAGVGGFGGVCKGTELGARSHELGHALNLLHAAEDQSYPYKGVMYGIQPPSVYKKVHVGPTWAYDYKKEAFISPIISKSTNYKGKIGQYKIEPMQGGGIGTQDEGFIFNHFSDYSVDKMRKFMQQHIIVWNGSSYATWDTSTGAYTNEIANNEVNFPMERDVEVISVMAGVSSVTPQATLVYPPIGAYSSGYIRLFDPNVEADRIDADQIYCPDGGCDVSLSVVQGGITKVYMLPIDLDASLSPTDYKSYKTRAINLKAIDGTVSKVELMLTPDAEINGVSSAPTILYTWEE